MTCLFLMKIRLKPLAAVLPLVCSFAPASAQQTGSASASLSLSTTLPSITVYASRFEEPLADALPQTLIVTAAEIQKSGASNVSEVLSRVAALPLRTNLDGSTNAVIDLRGYGDTASNNVVVLLDGVRLSENEQTVARTSMIPLEAIDHIEITQGGNSVLYGDGATGGTINIVTRKNAGDLTVLSGGLASYSGYQSGIYHSKVIGNSELSLFARQYASDNYRKSSQGNERSAGANWIQHIDPQTHIGARFFTSRERNKLPGALPSIYLDSTPRETQVPGYNYDAQVDSTSLTLFGAKSIGDVEWAIDLNQRVRDNQDTYIYDANTVFSGYAKYPDWYQAYGDSMARAETQSASPRVKIKNLWIPNNTLQMGYDWLYSKKSGSGVKSSSAYNVDDPADPWFYSPYKVNNSRYQFSHRSRAFYIRDVFDVSDADRIVLGYRREKYIQKFNLNYFNDNDPAASPGSTSYLSEDVVRGSEIEYIKKFNADLIGYLRFSRNYRIANPDDNSSSAAGTFIYPVWYPKPLSVQKSRDVDLGLNYRSDDAVTELSYFHSHVRNEIGYDPSQFGNVNYDPVKRQGFNLKQRLVLSGRWAVSGSLQYIQAKFVSGAYAGKAVPSVSPLTGNLSLEYQLAPKHQMTLTARSAKSRYMSGDFENIQSKVAGYVVGDLSYFYKEKNWSLVATVMNITAKKYSDTGFYKPSYTVPYNLTVYPNAGRGFSLTGRYVF